MDVTDLNAGLILVMVHFPPLVFLHLLEDLSRFLPFFIKSNESLYTTIVVQKIWGYNQTFGLASNWTCFPLLSSQFSPKLLPVLNDTLRGARAAGP